MMLMETTRYELPPEGITLLGYIVRRMHKTEWLAKVPSALAEGQAAKALEFVAVYAATSSTSFGRAHYQPQFNRTGETVSETDPHTGALVTTRLESSTPHYRIAYEALMPNRDLFRGSEHRLAHHAWERLGDLAVFAMVQEMRGRHDRIRECFLRSRKARGIEITGS